MRKKVLAVGGSYFVGRVFSLMAASSGEYDLFLLNRGSRPLKKDGVSEIVCDRRDANGMAAALPPDDWDAVVDFCAYEPGDVATLLAAIPGAVRQYVFISSCSVYQPDGPSPKTEGDALLEKGGDDPGLAYAFKKAQLEREVFPACAEKGARPTIFRPAFVYGPLNYAPRESFYFNRLLRGDPVPSPIDATGRFQFVYVKDIAGMIMAAFDNPRAFGETFNLSAPERFDYASYLDVLSRLHGSRPRTVPVTVRQVYDENIPLPFPLDFDALYDGSKAAAQLGVDYLPFAEGMSETYDLYMHAHRKET